MQWFLLFLAGLLEVVWAVGLKYTEGFTRTWPSIVVIAAMVGSVVLLGIAMKSLPVGTAYAVWMGIGAAGTVILAFTILLWALLSYPKPDPATAAAPLRASTSPGRMRSGPTSRAPWT
mgnify:CR=1 FL=1